MKSKFGKITATTLLLVVAFLLGANLLAPSIKARPTVAVAIPTLGSAELQGDIWYVDGNAATTGGDGKSWASPMQSLITAMAASHADIARSADRQWAARNTIYVKGDEIVEDYTALAQKTDIIGVGSNSGYGKAGITGTWIIPSTTAYMGCHFYNIMFNDAGATPIWDIDGQGGIEFHNCLFDASVASTGGILASECNWLVIDNCEFSAVSQSVEFDTYAIKIEDDTNAIYGVRIMNNIIETAGIGIDWDEASAYNCWVIDNCIYATGLVIDDDGDNTRYVGNKLITAVDVDTHGENTGWDFNPNLSIGNELIGSASEISNTVPIIEESDA
jgi:hypothetical protein